MTWVRRKVARVKRVTTEKYNPRSGKIERTTKPVVVEEYETVEVRDK